MNVRAWTVKYGTGSAQDEKQHFSENQLVRARECVLELALINEIQQVSLQDSEGTVYGRFVGGELVEGDPGLWEDLA